ncbi:hypothetical protein L1049_006514 [Liquidambar formosana]|uniref:UspA domain-containing protein n=1 Tax=Liquidambar formosana TaxID=63359 RepID=A0AAP0RFM9_LIQFO
MSEVEKTQVMGEDGGAAAAAGEGKKVMVAIDESDYSYHALMWVLDNLKESITATPLVIFASQAPPNYNYIYAASLSSARMFTVSSNPELTNSIQEKNKKVVLGLLEKAKGICASRGVNAETIAEVGDPKVAICAAVEKYKINLLVIGYRGMGVLKRAIIGSVSNYCVQNAKCPVLVVKKPDNS